MEVSSEVGVGSEFRVLLPYRGALPAHDDVTAAAPLATVAAHKRTILCVDDDPDMLKLLESIFQDASFAVVTAAGFTEAMHRVRTVRPDAVYADVHLKDGDGFAILEAMHKDPQLATIPVVMVSGADESARAAALGAFGFLRKPIDPDAVVGQLRTLLSRDLERLLVIEDDPDAQKLLVNIFGDVQVAVTVASNGKEGLERLRHMTPSAILLDLEMPVMDGFEFIARLRENPAWTSVPVVILSGLDLTTEQLGRLSAFSVAILAKGTDSERVWSTVVDAGARGASR
jgi:CheY-like chemotaxis protein